MAHDTDESKEEETQQTQEATQEISGSLPLLTEDTQQEVDWIPEQKVSPVKDHSYISEEAKVEVKRFRTETHQTEPSIQTKYSQYEKKESNFSLSMLKDGEEINLPLQVSSRIQE